jgi:hypothetical protein
MSPGLTAPVALWPFIRPSSYGGILMSCKFLKLLTVELEVLCHSLKLIEIQCI